MANITRQLDIIKNSTKGSDMRDAIVEALSIISSETNTKYATDSEVEELSKKIVELKSLYSQLTSSGLLTKDDINGFITTSDLRTLEGKINSALSSKADSDKLGDFATTGSVKELKSYIDKNLTTKETGSEVDDLSKKVNELKDLYIRLTGSGLLTKDDIKDFITTSDLRTLEWKINSALSLKADSNALGDYATAKSVKELAGSIDTISEKKASSEDLDTLRIKLEAGLKDTVTLDKVKDYVDKKVEENQQVIVENALEPVPELHLLSKSSPMMTRSSGDEVTRAGNVDLYGAVDQLTFDNIVGSGIQTWTLTDYVIRLRELYNELISSGLVDSTTANTFATKDALITLAEKVNAMGTKEDIQVIHDDIIAESDDIISGFDQRVSDLESFFTWDLSADWELGAIDSAEATDSIKTSKYLPARNFTAHVAEGYQYRHYLYNKNKGFVRNITWTSADSTLDLSSYANARYMRFDIKANDGTTITDIPSVASKLSVQIYGTSFINASNVASDSGKTPYLNTNGVIVFP